MRKVVGDKGCGRAAQAASVASFVVSTGDVAQGCKRSFWAENVTETLFFHKNSRKSLIISKKMRFFEIFCVYLRAFYEVQSKGASDSAGSHIGDEAVFATKRFFGDEAVFG